MYFHISKLVFGDWSTTWDHVLKVLGHGLNQVFFSKNLAWPVFNITFFPLNSWTWCFSHMLILYISVAVNQTDRIVLNKHMAKTSRSRVKGKKTWLLKKGRRFSETGNLCRQEKKWLRKDENRYRPEILTKCLCTDVRYVHQFSEVYYNICGVRDSLCSGHFYFRPLYLSKKVEKAFCPKI